MIKSQTRLKNIKFYNVFLHNKKSTKQMFSTFLELAIGIEPTTC
jgi:hypothetical protein